MQDSNQNPSVQIIEKPHTPFDCPDMRIDSKGYPTCFHNREFPTDCSPDNCHFLKDALK